MVDTQRIKELFRLTSIYALGNVFAAGLGFLLYPVYTTYLSPEQFGVIGLAMLVAAGVQHLFSLGTRGAAFNFYHRYEGKEREEFYTSLFVFTFVLSGVVVVVFEFVGPTLFRWLLGVDLYDPYFRIVILASAVIATFKTIPEQRLKAAERAKPAVFLGTGENVVNQVTSLVAVVGLSMGVVGYLLGTLVAAIVVGAAGTAYLARRAVASISLGKIRAALIYSLPLFPHYYSHFVISMADRVLLTRLGSLGAVGVYTLGYALANVLRLLVTSANSAIMPEFAAASEDDLAFNRLANVSTYYLLFAAVAAVSLSLFMPTTIRLFFPAAYHDAVTILPWLALAFFALAMYYVPMNVLSQTQRETKFIPLLTVVAAVSNIGMNYLLIPEYGIVGAAASTLAAYLLLALLVFGVTQRIRPVSYEYRRLTIIGAALVATIGLELALPQPGLVADVILRVALFAFFIGTVTVLGFWTGGEKAAARDGIRTTFDRISSFR